MFSYLENEGVFQKSVGQKVFFIVKKPLIYKNQYSEEINHPEEIPGIYQGESSQ